MPGIPARYAFLTTVGVLPRTVLHGLSLLGTNEVPGRGSNAAIEAWRDELNRAHPGSVIGFSDDSVPWCGLFAAIVAHRAGKKVVAQPLWARNWAGFGRPVEAPARASLGDVLVFVRDGGGHVGFYIAEDKSHYHVLGGNQSDSVTIARIAKSRCIAVRRPEMTRPPASMRPYRVAPSGAVSMDEA